MSSARIIEVQLDVAGSQVTDHANVRQDRR